jgi:hypothetical protein
MAPQRKRRFAEDGDGPPWNEKPSPESGAFGAFLPSVLSASRAQRRHCEGCTSLPVTVTTRPR